MERVSNASVSWPVVFITFFILLGNAEKKAKVEMEVDSDSEEEEEAGEEEEEEKPVKKEASPPKSPPKEQQLTKGQKKKLAAQKKTAVRWHFLLYLKLISFLFIFSHLN